MTYVSSEDTVRYARQIMLPEIGPQGQEKLRSASVFLSGVGGLGSVIAVYLVAAGIGHIRMVDRDRVELGNLNRQILHWTDDIGKAKVHSAAEKLTRLNPGCNIETFQEPVTEEGVDELLGGCTIIMDGTDNVETRKILNRAAFKKRLTYVFGGVDGFNGMATTIVPGETACFECLFPGMGPERKAPGVLGALPGLVASIQVLEAIKIILGMGGLLKSRLLHIRGADMRFTFVDVRRNPHCGLCGAGKGGACSESSH
jgi:adenylyltransferase/sulfurtransferase